MTLSKHPVARSGARLRLAAVPLALACLLGGCAATGGAGDAVATQAALPTQAAPPTQYLRTDREQQQMFAKGSANGRELLRELLALRAAAAARKPDQALTSLMGRPAKTSGGNFGIEDLMRKLAEATRTAGTAAASDIALANADLFLGKVIAREDLLVSQKVSLPKDALLTVAQRQQVLLIASMVVAIHVSNELVKQSADDFAAIEPQYRALLDRRQQAATLLQAALTDVRQADAARREAAARQMESLIGRDDLVFLQQFPQNMTLEQFKSDLPAQNIALRYLRAKNPAAFKDYQAQADKYVSAFGGYLKATTGTVAFLGFSTVFYTHASQLVQERQDGVALISPYVADLLSQVAELGKNLAPAASSLGSVWDSLFRSNGFNVDQGGKRVAIDVGVGRAFEKLTPEDKVTFSANMFRPDGYLSRLYSCDRAAVGDLLDRMVPTDVRQAFMRQYYALDDGSGLSFAAGLAGKIAPQLRKSLATDLMETRAARNGKGVTDATAAVQDSVVSQVDKLQRQELMRMSFAVHDGSAAQARIALRDSGLAPVPSTESIYVYELFTQGCLERWLQPAAPPPKPPPPPKPRQTPRPQAPAASQGQGR